MTRNQHIFSLASLVNGISFSMILPLLAPIIRQLKLSELQGGAMVSAGALWMAIAAIYISKHPAKYSVYQLLIIGFVGMTLTWALFSGVLLYSLNSSLSIMSVFLGFLVARASTGVFMAMPQIALQSYVMTAFNTEHTRSQAMAKFGALNSLGIVVGPFLTTLFLIGGLQTPLWIAVLILAVVTILILFCYEHQDRTQGLKLVPNVVQQEMLYNRISWCTATQALSFVIGPLISTGLYQWHSTLPYGLLIIGLIALTAYAWREKYLATQRNIHPNSLNEKSVDHHAVHQNSR